MTEQYRPTRLEIDLSALEENARRLRAKTPKTALLMAVVKADAYGHGLIESSKIMLDCGADALAVATVDEGIELRESRALAPILVLGGVTPEAAAASVKHHLSLALYDFATLNALQKQARKLDTVAHVHIKIDSGMNRVGVIGLDALRVLMAQLGDCPNVKLEGIFTHFADALDDPAFTREQNVRFMQSVQYVRDCGLRPLVHAAASAAMLSDESLWHDMVRPGIALYGASVRHLCPELIPAQRLVTKPVRVHKIPAGDTVGYGREFKAERETNVMTLPIGYGDGYPRLLGGKAAVLVRGQRAPIIGRVCMDMIMVDVTDVSGACMADEVVLMGEQLGTRITPDELATITGTIPYEIMLGFTKRVPVVHV